MDRSLSFTPPLPNRRQLLQITAAVGAVAMTGGFLSLTQRPVLSTTSPAIRQATRLLMGTRVHLTVIAVDEAQAVAAIEATFTAMMRLIGDFDHRQPQSPLAILNRTGQLANPSPALSDLLQQAIAYGDLTAGAFDVTVKPLLDARQAGRDDATALRHLVDYRQIELTDDRVRLAIPGAAVTLDGIAKGRVIDGGVEQLRELGFDQILVEAGGDLRTLGQRADGGPWRVGILHPRPTVQNQTLGLLGLAGQAVATSGDYMHHFTADYRQHHIIDPRTGNSPLELASATVLAPTALAADALGTALLVMGSATGLALVERLPGVEALLVTKDLRLVQSSHFLLD